MCKHMLTEYGCGHNLVHRDIPCAEKSASNPYQHFPLCKHAEVVRKCPGKCANCQPPFQEAVRHQRKKVSNSLKLRIFGPLRKIIVHRSDEASSIGSVFVPTQAPLPETKKPTTLTKRPPETVIPKRPNKTKVAIGTISKPLPYPLEGEAQPKHTITAERSWSTGDDLDSQWVSPPPGDTVSLLPAQLKAGSNSRVLPLNTLPSQQGKLLPRPDESIVRPEPARRRPLNRPVKSEIGESHLGGRNGWKINAPTALPKEPLPGPVVLPVKKPQAKQPQNNTQLKGKEPLRQNQLPISASKLWVGAKTTVVSRETLASRTAREIRGAPSVPDSHRRSRLDKQGAELFFDGGFPKAKEKNRETKVRSTPNILQAEGRANTLEKNDKNVPSMRSNLPPQLTYNAPMKKHGADVQSMPSILRPGGRDNTYKAYSVGQIPVHYDTTAQKAKNRKARLTTKEEENWPQFLDWAGLNERNKADATWADFENRAGVGPLSYQCQAQDGRAELADNTPVEKSENRKARLTTQEEEKWSQYLDWAGPSGYSKSEDAWEDYLKWAGVKPSSRDSQAQEKRAKLPAQRVSWQQALPHTVVTPVQEPNKMRSKDDVRMSFRVSNPGMHDFYSPNGPPTVTTLNNKNEMGAIKAKRETSVYSEQPRGKVPKPQLRDMRHLPLMWPEPESVWDRIVVKVVASIESFSTGERK